MITVVLVDDHFSVRKAIHDLLDTTKDIEVVATASDGTEAVTQARVNHPDIVVMDISMPVMNGLEATHQIRTYAPSTRVLIISSYDSPLYIKQALEVGAKGYVVKDTLATELIEAIRAIYNGKLYFGREMEEKTDVPRFDDHDSWAA